MGFFKFSLSSKILERLHFFDYVSLCSYIKIGDRKYWRVKFPHTIFCPVSCRSKFLKIHLQYIRLNSEDSTYLSEDPSIKMKSAYTTNPNLRFIGGSLQQLSEKLR